VTPATAVLLAVTATSGSRIWPRTIGLFQFFSDTGFHVVVLHVVTIALKRTVLSGGLDCMGQTDGGSPRAQYL